MTQVEFAKMLGTHQASLSQIELGIRGVSLQQVVKLARGLHVSPDKLLGLGKSNGNGKQQPALRNEKLMRRVRRIEQLSPAQQDAVVKILDGFLDAQGR